MFLVFYNRYIVSTRVRIHVVVWEFSWNVDSECLGSPFPTESEY